MLLRNTNATLFPSPLYKYRPDLIDPLRYRSSLRGMGIDYSAFATAGATGGMDPIADLQAVTSLFNRKSPEQIAYDTGRAQIYAAGVANQHAKDSTVGGDPLFEGVTRSQLLPYVQKACDLRQQLIALTDRYRSSIDSAWLTPRFNDYLAPLDAWCTSWQAQYNALGSDSIFQSVTDYIFGTQQPVIPGVAPYVNPNTDPNIYGTVHPSSVASSAASWLLPAAILGGLFLMSRPSRRYGVVSRG